MPKQPEDLVIRILRDIQGTLAEHTKMLAGLTKRFDRLERRLDALIKQLR
jgi:phage shock protein A